MSSDLQRLMRAVKVIAKLAWKYEQEDVAAAMMKHCSARERSDAALVGSFLDDIWQLNRKAEDEAEPRCCECGENIYDIKASECAKRGIDEDPPRTDVRYCSAKCRQRAYRKRVAANRSTNAAAVTSRPFRDASHVERVDHPSPGAVS
jgi:hypothetical protein